MVNVRERRDVEDLLIWALVDNGLGGEFMERGGKLTWQDYGTRIASGSRGWSVSGPRVQDDDAIRIAETVLALPRDPVTGQATMCDVVVRHARRN